LAESRDVAISATPVVSVKSLKAPLPRYHHTQDALVATVTKMRQKVFERAMQKRVDAAEAAFPPSGRPDDGQAVGE
jgi:hypothetical protein